MGGALVVTGFFSYGAKKSEINGMGLQELSSKGSKANQEPGDLKAPMLLFFVPAQGIASKFSSDEHDFREDLSQIAIGTALYDVVAVPDDDRCRVKYTLFADDPIAFKD